MAESLNTICHLCSMVTATLQCFCETPPILLCPSCIQNHIKKQGTPHKVALLSQAPIQKPEPPPPPASPIIPELQALKKPQKAEIPPFPPAPIPIYFQLPRPVPVESNIAPTETPPDFKMPQKDAEVQEIRSKPLLPTPPKSPIPVPREERKMEAAKEKPKRQLSRRQRKEMNKAKNREMARQHSEPVSPKAFKPKPLQASEPPTPKPEILKNPCYSCAKAEATVVLTCYEKPQMCCDECAKDDESVLPLCIYPRLTSPDAINTALDRYKFVKATKLQLQKNFKQINDFLKKAETQFAKSIKEIEDCKSRIFFKVNVFRDELDKSLKSALAEVENNLCNERYRPKGEYELVLWEKRVEDANFDLFVSRCSAPDIVGEITRTIDYEIRGLYALNCLPVITDVEVLKFNCQRQNWSPAIALDKPVKVSSHSVLTYLEKQDVLCSGFYEEGLGASGEAFIVNIATGFVEMLPAMENPRFHQGTICVGRNVYMFGGQNPDYMNSCEKYCLDHKQEKWSQLKEMLSQRACFNPLLHERLVYILGGANTRDSELYDFMRNNFLPLCLLMPVAAGVAAIEVASAIQIFQGSKVHVWVPAHKSIKYKTQARRGDVQRKEEEAAWSNFTPLIVKGFVYLMSNEKREIARQELGGRFDFHIISFPAEAKPEIADID